MKFKIYSTLTLFIALGTSGLTAAPIHEAASDGDLAAIKTIIDNLTGNPDEIQAQINATDENRWTPLHCAIINGYLKVAKYLIGKGADINAIDKRGRTPLHCAIIKGYRKAVKYLIGKGADINAIDKHGATPLHRAADQDNFEIVKLLIENDADINSVDNDGNKPLNIAQKQTNTNTINYLKAVAQGADLYRKNPIKFTGQKYIINGEINILPAEFFFKYFYKQSDINDAFAEIAAQFKTYGKMQELNRLVKDMKLWEDKEIEQTEK